MKTVKDKYLTRLVCEKAEKIIHIKGTWDDYYYAYITEDGHAFVPFGDIVEIYTPDEYIKT